MSSKDRVLIELAAKHDFLVGRREIRQAKLTSREWAYRVRRGEWVPVAPTVWRHAATPETWELKVRAAARWLGKSAALAGRSAAAWWGLDGFDQGVVEFVVPRERRS
ncbi:MAG: type IV toxin-antitoxin system AbiEi family antitoxin domain-containing protein, partial [Ilumatobacteraceae bacterium]